MGKNYSNYSKKEKELKEEVIETVETEPVKEDVIETVETEHVKEDVKESTLQGVVFNCERLNIRKGPNKKEDVLCIVDKGSKLTINDKTTKDWFKVTTEDGVEGFCMKKFVEVD